MSAPSAVRKTVHEAFDLHFLPLLRQIGFAPLKYKDPKPGVVVAYAVRHVDADRRVEATLWCDAGTGDHLRFRFDVVDRNDGTEYWRQVDLEVPWPEATGHKRRTLDFSGAEFRPQESVEQLATAIAFLAGGFAANGEAIAKGVPYLADAVRTASKTALWREAAERAAALWNRRHVRGDVDESVVAATVVFVGAQLVSLDCDGVRLTLKFDTRSFDRTLPVSLSGWHRTPAGTRIATKLTNGTRNWTFGYDGRLLSVTPP